MIGLLVRLVVLLCFAVFVGWLVGGFYLDAVVTKGLQRVGPDVTGTAVSVDKVSLSLVLGRGRILGLVVGNPRGFHTDRAYHVPEISVEFDPLSIVTGTVVIDRIHVKNPEITYEIGLNGTNLERIERRAKAFTRRHGGSSPSRQAGAEPARLTRVRISRIDVTDPTLRVSATLLRGGTLSFGLDDIHLRDVGSRTDGVTADQATSQVLAQTLTSVRRVVSRSGQVLAHGARRVDRQEGRKPASGDERAAKSLKKGLDDVQGVLGGIADFFRGGSGASTEDDSR